jgi:hypothetical protein
LPYEAAIDIRDLIRLEEVMEFHGLGPNGSILFCLEFLEKNFDWFSDRLAALTSPSSSSSSDHHPAQDDIDYIVLDLPGQVEISTDHVSLKNILHKLEKLDWRVSPNPLILRSARIGNDNIQHECLRFICVAVDSVSLIVSRSSIDRFDPCRRPHQIHINRSLESQNDAASWLTPSERADENRSIEAL